jgi:dipeptidyl aminopeptidase/acylaminoacyl peptidase
MSPEEPREGVIPPVAFELEPERGRIIRGDVRLPLSRDRAAGTAIDRAIVVCHGFKGFKDWGFFPYLSERLVADTEAIVVTFNFSGSGIGPDLQSFTDLEGFAHNTFSREVEDLETVVRGLRRGRLGEVSISPPERLGLFGHSRGAAAVVITGAGLPEVDAVVTWAGIASASRYESWFEASMGAEGMMYIVNTRTGQQLPLYRDVLDDLRENRERLDMETAAERLGDRLLVIHGSEDEAVPTEEASRLHAAAGADAELVIIEGAGHTFGVSHPFPGTNPWLEEVISLTAAHFQRLFPGSRS